MDIVYLTFDNTAGIPQAVVDGLNANGHWARLICTKKTYLRYPTSNYLSDIGCETAQEWVDEADVVIVNAGRSPRSHALRDCELTISPDKKTIRMGHGSYERKGKIIESGWDLHFVTTPDLLGLPNTQDAKWLPGPVDVHHPRYAMVDDFPEGTLYISHTPTRPEIKGTDEFLRAIELLGRDGYDIKPLLIQGMGNEEALKERRKAAFHFDQNVLGVYGISAVEGLLLGQRVLVGLQPQYKVMYRNRALDSQMPFVTTPSGVYQALKAQLDTTIGRESREWGRKWALHVHDNVKLTAEMLSQL